MLDRVVCVYRSNVDLYFYVIGGNQENEVIFSFFFVLLVPVLIFVTRVSNAADFGRRDTSGFAGGTGTGDA